MMPALAARKHISLEREDDTTKNENKIKSIADESLKQLSTQEELKVLGTFYLLNHLAVKAPVSDFTLKHRWAQKYIYILKTTVQVSTHWYRLKLYIWPAFNAVSVPF